MQATQPLHTLNTARAAFTAILVAALIVVAIVVAANVGSFVMSQAGANAGNPAPLVLDSDARHGIGGRFGTGPARAQ